MCSTRRVAERREREMEAAAERGRGGSIKYAQTLWNCSILKIENGKEERRRKVYGTFVTGVMQYS